MSGTGIRRKEIAERQRQREIARRKERAATNARLVEQAIARRGTGQTAVMVGTTTGPAPKECILKSAAYENAVRGLGYCVRCARCCRPQFCHADEGKGQGIKTDVRRGWAGCGRWSPTDPGCHYIVGTSGTLTKEERRAEDAEMARRTRAALRRAAAWPPSVPEWIED